MTRSVAMVLLMTEVLFTLVVWAGARRGHARNAPPEVGPVRRVAGGLFWRAEWMRS